MWDTVAILFIYFAFLTGIDTSAILYVESGSTLVLICPYTATTSAVIWRGPQRLSTYAINDQVNFHVPQSGRIRIDTELTAGKYVLKLLNFTQHDQGTYQCDTISKDTAVKFEIVVSIAEKQVLIAGRKDYILYAKLLDTFLISFDVKSFKDPLIKWILSAGGKISKWQLNRFNRSLFDATSTLIADNPFQFRLYDLQIKEGVGYVNTKILLLSSYIRIMERETSCDMWSSINLTCETTTTIASALKHIWVQTYNDVTIEERVGHIEGNISVLTIPFCVYQDAGNYSCKWYSKKDEYIAVATVHVRSQPILTENKVTLHGDNILLEVKYHSDPVPDIIVWTFDKKIITVSEKYDIHVQFSTVKITFKSKVIPTTGFVAMLTIKNVTEEDIGVYKCDIKNSEDVIGVEFKKKPIMDALLRANETDSLGMTEINTIIWTVVYTAISSAVAFVATFTVIMIKRGQRRTHLNPTGLVSGSTMQQANEQMPEQQSTTHDSINSDRDYDEIESVISSNEEQDHSQEERSYYNALMSNNSHEYYNEGSIYVDLLTTREHHAYWKYGGDYQHV